MNSLGAESVSQVPSVEDRGEEWWLRRIPHPWLVSVSFQQVYALFCSTKGYALCCSSVNKSLSFILETKDLYLVSITKMNWTSGLLDYRDSASVPLTSDGTEGLDPMWLEWWWPEY